MLRLFIIIISVAAACNALSAVKARTYNYFAFGSNMCSSTMINLRNTSPLASTAAMLPDHELKFNIPGLIGVEPSSASVEPAIGKLVHGTLYKLKEEDFNTICQTEGVPFAYSLHRCRVVPYQGDGKRAGDEYLQRLMDGKGKCYNKTETSEKVYNCDGIGVPAFTLRAARKEWRNSRDIPPSQSYLNVLIKGAIEFKLDEAYVRMLKDMKPGRTLGNGLAEQLLIMAERRKRK